MRYYKIRTQGKSYGDYDAEIIDAPVEVDDNENIHEIYERMSSGSEWSDIEEICKGEYDFLVRQRELRFARFRR